LPYPFRAVIRPTKNPPLRAGGFLRLCLNLFLSGLELLHQLALELFVLQRLFQPALEKTVRIDRGFVLGTSATISP
jgi:hypothetical protein